MIKGVVYMLIAAFAFTWMNLLAKYLEDFHPLQVVFFRCVGTFIFIFPYMLIKRVPVLGKNKFWLTTRGLLSFVSLALYFVVIQRIPLGSAVALRYTAPLFSAIFALWFLKEKVKPWQWVALVISVIGALVLKGVDFRIDTMSFILIIMSSVLVGGVFTIVRYLGSREHFLTIINYFMVISIIGSLFFIQHWRMPVGVEWWYVSGIGVFGLFGQVFLTRSFQLADTATVAPIKYMELVYALILGYFLFNERYDTAPLVGMGILVIGMLLNVWVKRRA
ncbi:EamA family transporter [Dokdonia sp. Dokd-P16]|uniref:DMT family transporter n=1 Tax=Dokdonia sp. Dokd-P16 TaxID=2173169 RepID=UPI000D546118|nr:DMT family transporter [Dokdonia sp. Dokd-P16]AWH73285.1 EamA family transporter [Dokdonia sp. Dokd-P16]